MDDNKTPRPSWPEYFFELVEIVSKRSTCIRRKVGALIVKDKHILATGYNGPPVGVRHCSETGCLRDKLKVPSGQRHELCRGLHAEQNAIIQSAIHGVSIKGAELYSTTQPCIVCTKMIINAKIKKIYYIGSYPDELSLQMLEEAGISLERLS